MNFDPRENASSNPAPRGTGDWPRESSTMYIYGTSQVHAAQPLNAPHRAAPAAGATKPFSSSGVDHLDLSPEADFVAQVRDLPEIREAARRDRLAPLAAANKS
jgi:hypothetical protein